MPVISFVSSYVSTDASARPAVEFAVEHGFHGIELTGRVYWPDVLTSHEIDWLLARAREHDITFTIHFPFPAAPASHHSARWNGYLQQMSETIGVAKVLEAKVIVLHPGVIDCPGIDPARATEPLRRDAVENLARFLSRVAPQAEDAGTVVCLENMHHRQTDVIRSYQQLVDVVERVDSAAVRVVLDVGHAAIQNSLDAAVKALRPYIHHLHLDDARDGVDHIEIGTGDIDMDTYAGLMQPGGPAIATLEVVDEADLAGCILRSRDVLRAKFGDLVK